ncbi:MAG: hypothetical protein H7844_00410 [Nitrospirae bacterium YQR-1]
MKSEKSEQIRIKYLYRGLIMKGKIRIPYKAAAQMVGPDCAYHLYGTHMTAIDDSGTGKNKSVQSAFPKCNSNSNLKV